MGQRPPVEPPLEPALLALQHPQHLHHHLFLAGLQQHRSVEPMRVKIGDQFPCPSLPSASPQTLSQSLTPCPFLGGQPCPQLSMDTPMPELPMGQQEQELRQLLNKDKSKRSKDGGLPPVSMAHPPGHRRAGVVVTPAPGLPLLAGL